MRSDVRPTAVDGRFYPGDPERLRETVESLLDRAAAPLADDDSPKAIIAPHAGYRCSGPIAASAYATLAPARSLVRRVVIAGPAHFSPVATVAVSSAEAFATPLGPVMVDDDARRQIIEFAGVVEDDHAHAHEHSVEVQLPFVLVALGDVSIVPVLVGAAGAAVLAGTLDRLWDGPATRIVISTDLSHYHTAAIAEALDRRTAEAVCRLEAPSFDAACGAAAVGGMLLAAREHDLDVRLLDLRNSASTCGDADRVVGYGAFAFAERSAAASTTCRGAVLPKRS
jgi:MEMO1 family protein